jgi:toxin FitB
MRFLVDTNVISELAKPRPDAHVRRWASVGIEAAFMSSISIGEIIKGIERLAAGQRRSALEDWLNVLSTDAFKARVIPVDEVIAAEWGRLSAEVRRTLPCADSLLAATARVHGLAIVTRNVRDFADFRVSIVNPWLA